MVLVCFSHAPAAKLVAYCAAHGYIAAAPLTARLQSVVSPYRRAVTTICSLFKHRATTTTVVTVPRSRRVVRCRVRCTQFNKTASNMSTLSSKLFSLETLKLSSGAALRSQTFFKSGRNSTNRHTNKRRNYCVT